MSEPIRLVLLSCCAPCSCGAIKQVAERRAQVEGIPRRAVATPSLFALRPATLAELPSISDFIVLFYNPNIYPETEYQKRLGEQIKYCDQLGVKYAGGDYDHDEWLKRVQGLESEPERGLRCEACFRHRFEFARKFALENGYNAIASVFGVSKHKDQAQVDRAAMLRRNEEQEQGTGIRYLPIKWDEGLRQEINKKAGFYRQNYCGCEFSIRK
jgi:predicted adenine nucleotide alpha hydrolase (AANH) superfamily ATPase